MISPACVRFLAELGADGRRHSGGTLRGHFTAVHNILARWGRPAHLCRAGLFHSIYGTEPYGSALVSLRERARIREVIGVDSERIIYDYAATPTWSLALIGLAASPCAAWDRFSDAARPISSADINDLLCVRLADFFEQAPRLTMIAAMPVGEGAQAFWDTVAQRLGPPMHDDWRAYAAAHDSPARVHREL